MLAPTGWRLYRKISFFVSNTQWITSLARQQIGVVRSVMCAGRRTMHFKELGGRDSVYIFWSGKILLLQNGVGKGWVRKPRREEHTYPNSALALDRTWFKLQLCHPSATANVH